MIKLGQRLRVSRVRAQEVPVPIVAEDGGGGDVVIVTVLSRLSGNH